jgi:hypothetical protein
MIRVLGPPSDALNVAARSDRPGGESPARLPALSTTFLVALLVLDSMLIFGHVAFFAFGLNDGRLLLSYEPGYGEVFQYTKLFGLAVAFTACAVVARRGTWLAWTLVFAYLGIDDAFYLHETFGRRWQDSGREFGFRVQDGFEALFSATVGLVLLAALALSWRRGDALFRWLSVRLLVGLAGLAFVGVGIDILHEHAWVQPYRWLHHGLGLLEDGGELVVVSIMVGMVAQALDRPRTQPPRISERAPAAPGERRSA